MNSIGEEPNRIVGRAHVVATARALTRTVIVIAMWEMMFGDLIQVRIAIFSILFCYCSNFIFKLFSIFEKAVTATTGKIAT